MIEELKKYGDILLEKSLNDLENKEPTLKWFKCKDLIYFCENLMARPSEWFEAKQLVKEYREIKNERV